MKPQSEELREALAWRTWKINYYKAIIENAGSSSILTASERDSVRRVTSERMQRLQEANDEEVVKLYSFHMAIVMAVFKAVSLTDELID